MAKKTFVVYVLNHDLSLDRSLYPFLFANALVPVLEGRPVPILVNALAHCNSDRPMVPDIIRSETSKIIGRR